MVIWNVGTESDAILSVTDIKTTYENQPKNTGRLTVSHRTAQEALTSMGFALQEQPAPVLTPKYPTLSYEGQVCCNVFFTAEELGALGAKDLGMVVFNTEQTDGTVETAADVITGAVEMNGMYMVSTNGIPAKNLGDTLYFKVFAKLADGSYVYSDMYSYSPLKYAKNILANSDSDSHKALVVAMLNYGAEAQKYFGYNTDNLMNKDLTAQQQELVAGYSADSLKGVVKADAAKEGSLASNGGFSRRYPAVSFEGAFRINYHFVPSNAVEGEMTFYYWNEDTYNAVTELTADNADGCAVMKLADGVYTADSEEIAAKEIDKTIYVAAVYESEGVTYSTGVLAYSLAAYCQEHAANAGSAMNAFAKAAAVYGCIAKEYVGA